ncbi:hypothetical protein EDB80DRAFT_705721 [Ilyonectria destructans]|nr:hypothetical protein EDB80DRAFT_705721 [Ilyonectria destructans]
MSPETHRERTTGSLGGRIWVEGDRGQPIEASLPPHSPPGAQGRRVAGSQTGIPLTTGAVAPGAFVLATDHWARDPKEWNSNTHLFSPPAIACRGSSRPSVPRPSTTQPRSTQPRPLLTSSPPLRESPAPQQKQLKSTWSLAGSQASPVCHACQPQAPKPAAKATRPHTKHTTRYTPRPDAIPFPFPEPGLAWPSPRKPAWLCRPLGPCWRPAGSLSYGCHQALGARWSLPAWAPAIRSASSVRRSAGPLVSTNTTALGSPTQLVHALQQRILRCAVRSRSAESVPTGGPARSSTAGHLHR